MADIFISYAREDETTARQLRDVLASQGWDVWRDKEGIVTGTSWGDSIEHALHDAKCVVVLWSKHALASHFVRDEAEIGRNANKLVPVQIGDVELPIGFRGIQTANLVQWTGDVDDSEYCKLVRAIGDRLGATAAGPLETPPAGAAWRRWLAKAQALARQRRVQYVAGGAVLGIVLLWTATRLWTGGDPHDALEQGLKNFLDQRYVEAEQELRDAYTHGSGLAAHYLALMYANGQGVKQDDAKALEWALRGAARGDAHAQNYAGFLLGSGRGAKKDDAQAFELFMRAAEQGLGLAAYNVGVNYANGRGTHPDAQKAVDYYRRASDLGEPLAGNALGDMYRFGKGVGLDLNRAAYWYRIAAERGDASGSNNLGFLYINGQGVPVDDRRAVELFRHAADLNNASALNNLGYMYETGRGVGMDLNFAMTLYKRAADLGDRMAVSNLSRVQERLRNQPTRR